MSEEADPLRWQAILEVNPKAKEGMYNTERKALLRVGAHVLLSRMTAESWIPELRIRRQTAEAAAKAQEKPIPEMKDEVRVTIVKIPDETKADPVDGKILVEADGIQTEIHASVFYNCIKGPDTCPESFVTNVPLIGHGGSVPTRGGTSHANFSQRPDRQ